MSEAMQSSLTTLEVLVLVGEHQPVSVAEVAKLIDRPKSSAQRALLTLFEGGWIRPNGVDRTRWLLTARVAEVARQVGNQDGLRDAASPVLARLRDATLESVSLCVLEGDETVSIDFFEGRRTIRYVAPVGIRLPLHVGASGKVILANLPRERCDQILDGPLRSYTAKTMTSKRRIKSELAAIRADGYGVSIGEFTDEGAGIACVILAPDRQPIASVALELPQNRASSPEDVELLARSLMEAAAEIERALGGGH